MSETGAARAEENGAKRDAKGSRTKKIVIWALVILAIVAVALFAIWRWAAANQSVATLDTLDSIFTSGDADLAAGPVRFGDEDGQVLYVWTPDEAADGPRPVVVWIHGGGWNRGDPADYAFVARNLASQGYLTVVAGYRLVPGGEYPAMLQDGATAIAWTYRNIAEYGGDPEKIALMGHSAGAYNAVMLGLDRQWLDAEGLPNDVVDAVVGLAGPYDIYPFTADSTRAAFGDWPRLEEIDAFTYVRADAPPMLLATGRQDETVDPRHSVELGAALTEAGGAGQAITFDDMGHSGIVMKLARPFDRDERVKTAVYSFLAGEFAQPDIPASQRKTDGDSLDEEPSDERP